jgi:riboflavin biosynthesis pyrimidine reductase
VRVILDPGRRLGPARRVFAGGPPTLIACAAGAPGGRVGQAELLRIECGPEGLDLAQLLAALAARGLRRVFVEGGGVTLSHFLAAGLLDRLHVTIAPLLLGCGLPGFVLPEAASPAEALRFRWSVHPLGDDLLLDIPLDRRKPDVCT